MKLIIWAEAEIRTVKMYKSKKIICSFVIKEKNVYVMLCFQVSRTFYMFDENALDHEKNMLLSFFNKSMGKTG